MANGKSNDGALSTALFLFGGAALVYAAYETGRASQAISDAKAVLRDERGEGRPAEEPTVMHGLRR